MERFRRLQSFLSSRCNKALRIHLLAFFSLSWLLSLVHYLLAVRKLFNHRNTVTTRRTSRACIHCCTCDIDNCCCSQLLQLAALNATEALPIEANKDSRKVIHKVRRLFIRNLDSVYLAALAPIEVEYPEDGIGQFILLLPVLWFSSRFNSKFRGQCKPRRRRRRGAKLQVPQLPESVRQG